MKQTIFFTALLTVSCFMTLKGQEAETVKERPDFHIVEIGFRFMPTVSAFSMRTYDGGTVQGQATLGYGIGGMLAVNFTNHVGIQGEIIYNSLTQKYSDQEMERTLHVSYVNFPLLLSLNTGKSKPVNLNFVVGPQVGYNVGSRIETSGSSGSDTMQAIVVMRKGDVGFAYGAGLEFALNEVRTIRLDIGFRGVLGFLDIRDPDPQPDSRTYNVIDNNNVKTYSAYVGFAFLF
ncbi:MAG TPA: porin family protein [Bacteroidia bacterium]|nr:porin family protein [Bacteroidia bacterium]